MREMRESIKIIRLCLFFLLDFSFFPSLFKASNYKIMLPSKSDIKTNMESLINHFKLFSEGFSVPPNSVYTGIEAPKGEFGVFLQSDGTNKPSRCKIRAPGFFHLQGLRFM